MTRGGLIPKDVTKLPMSYHREIAERWWQVALFLRPRQEHPLPSTKIQHTVIDQWYDGCESGLKLICAELFDPNGMPLQ